MKYIKPEINIEKAEIENIITVSVQTVEEWSDNNSHLTQKTVDYNNLIEWGAF